MAKFVAALLLAGTAFAAAAGIYPDDHWSFSTKVSTDTYAAHVKQAVDSGKTLFMRLIASEGCGCCRKQAPAWNSIVKEYAGSDHVTFADVNLSEGQVSPAYAAGAGGWPTVRYFNAETGYEGKPYTQKTSKSMCDELGDMQYMRGYIEEFGAKPCDAASDALANCSEKEAAFATTWKTSKSVAQRTAEVARLEKMGATLVATPAVLKWHRQRLAILKRLVQKDEL